MNGESYDVASEPHHAHREDQFCAACWGGITVLPLDTRIEKVNRQYPWFFQASSESLGEARYGETPSLARAALEQAIRLKRASEGDSVLSAPALGFPLAGQSQPACNSLQRPEGEAPATPSGTLPPLAITEDDFRGGVVLGAALLALCAAFGALCGYVAGRAR